MDYMPVVHNSYHVNLYLEWQMIYFAGEGGSNNLQKI